MASDINQVEITGRLTRDPELRFSQGGAAVATFAVANNRYFQRNDEWEESVSFIDIVAFQKLAELVAENLGKGDSVLVLGRLEQETWEDKDTGAKRSRHKVVASRVDKVANIRPPKDASEDAPREAGAEEGW